MDSKEIGSKAMKEIFICVYNIYTLHYKVTLKKTFKGLLSQLEYS